MNPRKFARTIRQNIVGKARADFWSGLLFADRFKCLPPEYTVRARRVLDAAGEHIHAMRHTCPCGGLCAEGWD